MHNVAAVDVHFHMWWCRPETTSPSGEHPLLPTRAIEVPEDCGTVPELVRLRIQGSLGWIGPRG